MNITAAHSSRVKKTRKPSQNPFLRRSSSSPFSSNPRQKPSQPSKEKRVATEDDADRMFNERLDDNGVIASLATDLNFRDVPQFIQHIQTRMFGDIPERAPGMNSTRIAEILNYRAALPPIVTLAHVHALSNSPTKTEREIAELAQAGIIRKVAVPNRGVGAAAVGDGLVLVSEWERLVYSHSDLGEEVKVKYLSLFKDNPTSTTVSGINFTPAEVSALTTAGFLTSATATTSQTDLFARPGAASLGTLASLSTAGSKNASGSLAAVGGSEALTNISGGSGPRSRSTIRYNFSLPNTGSHLRLLLAARTHILNLLKRSKYREAPMNILNERWDGGIAADDEQSQARKARGEFVGVLSGRTKKWKQFYGLRFEWVLEECVGAGLVELFETGSVGKGVRAI